MVHRTLTILWRAGAMLAACGANAQAQTPAEFYKGKQITLLVGSGAGGGVRPVRGSHLMRGRDHRLHR